MFSDIVKKLNTSNLTFSEWHTIIACMEHTRKMLLSDAEKEKVKFTLQYGELVIVDLMGSKFKIPK